MLKTLNSTIRIEIRRRLYSTKKSDKKPIISCKRPEFDHFEGQSYNKFKGVTLASQGWLHNKSKNDHFTIHLNANKPEEKPAAITDSSKTFKDIGLSEELIEIIERKGFKNPTFIQSKGIRSMLAGNNTVITAETGCGKTFAYFFPILQNLIEWKRHSPNEELNSPLAVVIVPSRELGKQIGYVAKEFCKYFDINVTTVIGGHTKRQIINPPVEYCDLLVTTLGAFNKLVAAGIYKVHNVHHVVLDEADTLLDDSFREKLTHLLKKFAIQYHTPPAIPPHGCQLTMASATMPRELPDQVCSFVNPESLKIVTTKNIHRLMPHVPQKFMRVGKAQKSLELLKLVKADINLKRPCIIFSNKSDTCDWISMFLNESNMECLNLSARMHPDLQIGIFDNYKTGKVNIISCTDIASRGLDTIRTQHIINFDFPLYTADYIHRCGRTGRLGGPDHCFVTNFVAWPREIALVQKIEMSVRKHEELPSVNANINKLIQERIHNITIRDIRRAQNARG